MKWTITNIMYACFACLLVTGLLHECHLQWMGNAFAVATGVLLLLAILKYLNGDHLR